MLIKNLQLFETILLATPCGMFSQFILSFDIGDISHYEGSFSGVGEGSGVMPLPRFLGLLMVEGHGGNPQPSVLPMRQKK